MAKFPSAPLKPPVAFEHGSGAGHTTPAKVPSTERAAPPSPKKPLATSTSGKRNHDNGGMTYKTGHVYGSRILAHRNKG